jgi:hypothetical protein
MTTFLLENNTGSNELERLSASLKEAAYKVETGQLKFNEIELSLFFRTLAEKVENAAQDDDLHWQILDDHRSDIEKEVRRDVCSDLESTKEKMKQEFDDLMTTIEAMISG